MASEKPVRLPQTFAEASTTDRMNFCYFEGRGIADAVPVRRIERTNPPGRWGGRSDGIYGKLHPHTRNGIALFGETPLN